MLKIIFLLIAAVIPVMTLTLIVLAITSLLRIPLKYILGNLKSRRVSTFMSILGIGVVIAVMLSMQALDRGVTLATQSTASKNVLIVMREGSEAEISSWVTRDAEQIIRTLHGVAKVSPELTLIFKLPRAGAPKGSNVIVRGVTPAAFEVRPYVKIVDGRMFRPSTNELIVSKRISDRFNLHVGETFTFG